MSKGRFIALAAFAVLMAILIPLWAISKDGPGDSPAKVAESDEKAKELFATNCGTCHTLKRAGSDGVVGPDLDESDIAPSSEAVLGFILNGSSGKMPAGILQGENANLVADFVSRVAGE